MAQPTPFTRETAFAAEETNAVGGRSTVRTAALDAELDAAALTVSQVLANLAIIQRDDTKLRDATVELHTLAADVRALLAVGTVSTANLRGAWLTATAYVPRDIATSSGNTYICAIGHTSGTFATDLAASRWLLLSLGAAVNASTVVFSPSATVAASTVQAAVEEVDTKNRALSAAASAAALAISADLADSTSASKGAALVAYNPVQAYLAGTVGKFLYDLVLTATDYTSLQVAISAAKVLGRPTKILLNGTVSTSTLILIDSSNILIEGAGSDTAHDVGTQGAGARARINWTGAPGGTVLRFASPTGASNQACTGGGMKEVFIDCAGTAAIGLQVLSWRRGTFTDLHFNNPTTVGLDLGVVATLGEARDTQNNEFKKISSRHYEVSGGTGGLLRLGGDATANTSLNCFEQLDCQFSNGDAYVLNNSDNNVILRARAFRSGGTGNAIVFNGSNAGAAETARSNIFIQLTTNGAIPIVHKGTSSFTHPSIDNSVLLIDYDNGYSPPTFETGATGSWSDTRGIQAKMGFMNAGAGDDITNVAAARARVGTSGTMHLVNGASDHLQMSDAANTNRWGTNLDGSGNYRTVRLAGTGVYLDALNAYGNYANDAAAASGGVPVGGRYRNGSIMMIRVT